MGLQNGFHLPIMHPLAFMDPKKKKEIMDDLVEFTKAQDCYTKIETPWKRGYLLYGPPGTAKSTMIAAIANFLRYDIYDLELTAVKDNTNLRKFIEISKRGIVVIEDIDCSLQITRRKREITRIKWTIIIYNNNKKDDPIVDAIRKARDGGGDNDEKEESKVALSGLLNFMDGLWWASGGERIFVFTTNHLDKIDDALIRRGRMFKLIEMSYRCFEAFRVLAKNYLNLDSHEDFDKIRCLLSEIEISTADVAESLMPKSAEMGADECLEILIKALNKAKEEAAEAKKMGGERECRAAAQRGFPSAQETLRATSLRKNRKDLISAEKYVTILEK